MVYVDRRKVKLFLRLGVNGTCGSCHGCLAALEKSWALCGQMLVSRGKSSGERIAGQRGWSTGFLQVKKELRFWIPVWLLYIARSGLCLTA